MNKSDARTLPQKVQASLRQQAIHLHDKASPGRKCQRRRSEYLHGPGYGAVVTGSRARRDWPVANEGVDVEKGRSLLVATELRIQYLLAAHRSDWMPIRRDRRVPASLGLHAATAALAARALEQTKELGNATGKYAL